MKIRDYGIITLLACLLVQTVSLISVQAGIPWKWQFNMVNVKSETPMKLPVSIYLDEKRQRFYVADPATNSLHSFNKDGDYVSTFNPGDQIAKPFALVRDDQDVLWVVAKEQNSLTRVDLKAKSLTQNKLTVAGREIHPDRLGYANKMFYVLDKLSGDVISFNSSLEADTVYTCEECAGGFIDFIVKKGSLWGLARTEQAVYEFNLDGSLQRKVILDGELKFPVALEVGGAGLFYILDRHAGSIAVFDGTGKFKYSFLGKGHVRNKLYYPEDLFLDQSGRLYVVDSGNIRVEVFGR